MASYYELWMDILDFSCILGFPHKYFLRDGGKTLLLLFHQLKNHAMSHVQAFIQLIQSRKIVHEDISLRLFLLSLYLEDNLSVKNWYEGFPRKVFLQSRNSLMHSTQIGITVSKNRKERLWSKEYGKIPWEKSILKMIEEKEPMMIFHSSLNIQIIRPLQKWKLVSLLLIYWLSQDTHMSYQRHSSIPSRVAMIIPCIMWNGLWLWL